MLTWIADYVIYATDGEKRFEIINTKRDILEVTLSMQDNTELLQQLKSGFKRRISWNKYYSKAQ